MEAGVFDQKLFHAFEEIGIGYVSTGKLMNDITELARGVDSVAWTEWQKTEWSAPSTRGGRAKTSSGS